MLTVRRRPVGVPTVFNLFDEMFNQVAPNLQSARKGAFVPAVNVSERDQAFDLEFAAPGFEKGDFRVHLENEMLVISANREESKEAKEKNFTRREFHFGSFERSFTLPENVDADNIQATYTNGILHVQLPKKSVQTSATKKQIEIR